MFNRPYPRLTCELWLSFCYFCPGYHNGNSLPRRDHKGQRILCPAGMYPASSNGSSYQFAMIPLVRRSWACPASEITLHLLSKYPARPTWSSWSGTVFWNYCLHLLQLPPWYEYFADIFFHHWDPPPITKTGSRVLSSSPIVISQWRSLEWSSGQTCALWLHAGSMGLTKMADIPLANSGLVDPLLWWET